MRFETIMPVFAYCVLIFWLLHKEILLQRKEGPRTARNTALGRSSFGAVVIAITLIGSNLGPADTIGLTEEGAKYGFFFLIFPLCAGLQHIIAGKFFAEKIALRSSSCVTMADKMGICISTQTRVIIGLVTVAQALAFTGILALAGGQILESLFNLPLTSGILITAIFVGLYAWVGGMNAIIKTDRLQFYIVVGVGIIAVIAAIVLLTKNTSIVDSSWYWRPGTGNFTLRSGLALAIAYFLGEAFLPMYSIRAFISKKPKDASRAFMGFGGAIIIYYAIMIFVGISSNSMDSQSAISGLVIVNVISSLGQVVWIKWILAGFAFTALLSLTHSTLDSVLNAGASALAIDVLNPFVNFTDEQMEKQIRSGLLIIAIFGTVFSLVSDNLIEILLIGYTIWVPTIVFPFAYILLNRNKMRSKNSTLMGIIGGVFGFIVGSMFLKDFQIPPILIGFISNGLFFIGTELWARHKKKPVLKEDQ